MFFREIEMIFRVHVFISGTVQGVSFRWETLTKARNGNVNGWIRNLSDGRVEAVFEGEETMVKAMIDFCRQGPSGARVNRVQVIYGEPMENFKTFEIHF